MKKIIVIFCFSILSIPSFSQQFLWSTADSTSSTHIPIEEVNDEILKFYDHYESYLDGAGFNKDTFFKEISKYAGKTKGWTDFKNEISKIDKLTVFAVRTNSGNGSEILVLLITKDNVNILTFTNSYNSDAIRCYPFDRDKFEKWLETLKK